ncbi:MAG: phosphatase PAP2 family protein [Syntrophales bacterium]|nr:phosphatase PAP2 family protein [Syntrophales bacterium]
MPELWGIPSMTSWRSHLFSTGYHLAILSAVLLLVAVCYGWVDIPVALYCRHLPEEVRDFFNVVTLLGDSTVYLVMSALWFLSALLGGKDRTGARAALYMFSAVAASGLVTDALKVLAGRWRPPAFFAQGLYGFEFFEMGYLINSFPSGHATTICALAYALSLFSPPYRPVWWAIATVVCVSRVVIGSHYPSDVMMGAYVGIFVAFLLKRVPFFSSLFARREQEV